MERMTSTLLCTAVLLGALGAGPAAADDHDPLAKALESALASEQRSDAEKARDKNRKPLETLQFFGLKPGMRVLELVPGGGWYTKLLAPVLREDGKLFVAVGAGRVKERLLDKPGFDAVEIVAEDAKIERRGGLAAIDELDLGVRRIDLALTFRNLHNFDPDSRDVINKAVFKALKRGGLYGVVDHTRRHMQGDERENRRRMDPVLAIKEIQAAGFEFVDYSDLHYRLDDELRYEVGRRSVAGNTDRFTLLFRKP
ncbi:MAG: methyltransferase [Pseudomonadota bacterium]